jgi:hypothetical protein
LLDSDRFWPEQVMLTMMKASKTRYERKTSATFQCVEKRASNVGHLCQDMLWTTMPETSNCV